MIWGLILLAFAAWGVTPFEVTVQSEPNQITSAAAGDYLDGSCGLFINFYKFERMVASGAAEGFPQTVITHEIGHCLGHDHPLIYKDTIMLNAPSPTPEDLQMKPTHEPWFTPYQYRSVIALP